MSSSNTTDTHPPEAAAESLVGSVLASVVVMFFFASLAVALRFWVRGKMLHTLKMEDWCILVSLVCSAASTAIVVKQVEVGLGRHIWTLTSQNVQDYLHISYFRSLFYHMSLAFTKASFLCLYLRFLTAHDFIRRLTRVVLGMVIVYNMWLFAMHMTMCIPLAKAWDRSIPGRCQGHTVWYAVAYLHIATDFIIFLLPLPVVATMTIPVRQKVGLFVVFAAGFFVCLISILRVIWLRQMINRTDMTWDLVAISNWNNIEINLAIICACLTTLKPIWSTYLKPLLGHRSEQQGPSTAPISDSRPVTIGSTPLDAFRRFRQNMTFGSTNTAMRLESVDIAEKGMRAKGMDGYPGAKELDSTAVGEPSRDTRLQAQVSKSSMGGSGESDISQSKSPSQAEVL